MNATFAILVHTKPIPEPPCVHYVQRVESYLPELQLIGTMNCLIVNCVEFVVLIHSKVMPRIVNLCMSAKTTGSIQCDGCNPGTFQIKVTLTRWKYN